MTDTTQILNIRTLDSDNPRISDADLPAIFRAADTAAKTAQSYYLRIVLADLGLVLASAITTSVAVSSDRWREAWAVAGAGCFFIGLILTGFVIRRGYDRLWFQARAVAESAKTMAWRYMVGAEPYETGLTELEADSIICGELQSVLRERRVITGALGGEEATGEQITAAMRSVRASDLDMRKSVYLRDRLSQQRGWYSDNAKFNEKRSDFWLYVILGSQIAGVIAALALVKWPMMLFNGASVVAAATAVFMAWLQLKRHQELASSYGMAVHELGLIEVRLRHVKSDTELSVLVLDAENAISREHTMWVARRDVIG